MSGTPPTVRADALPTARPDVDDALSETVAADPPVVGADAAVGDALARGRTIGRFTILRELGSGGMGIVYAARDEQLERTVALKLLHGGDASGSGGESERRRLLREAKALARLSHPAVVTVLDVGVHDGQTFLAMEFIDGQTLDRWLHATRQSWREVISVYLRAGEGLAAAHAAGIVHRDFKPANVMVREDGRVVVLDFGLARAPLTPPSDEELAAAAARDSTRALDLTATGTIVGTPAYMSPEQFTAGELTTASDQFSFCVALFEGLHGVRPFAGRSVEELARHVVSGERRVAPPQSLPPALEVVLARGLSTRPEDRYPSMDALLEQLRALLEAPAPAPARWWPRLLAVGVIAAVTIPAVGSLREAPTQAELALADVSGRDDGDALPGDAAVAMRLPLRYVDAATALPFAEAVVEAPFSVRAAPGGHALLLVGPASAKSQGEAQEGRLRSLLTVVDKLEDADAVQSVPSDRIRHRATRVAVSDKRPAPRPARGATKEASRAEVELRVEPAGDEEPGAPAPDETAELELSAELDGDAEPELAQLLQQLDAIAGLEEVDEKHVRGLLVARELAGLAEVRAHIEAQEFRSEREREEALRSLEAGVRVLKHGLASGPKMKWCFEMPGAEEPTCFKSPLGCRRAADRALGAGKGVCLPGESPS
ncbi:MAG: serine/threonine protein kinase [Myxococcales bacterium]|nr:serine/threonine protein kinase [Myxococcales bacterium]